MNRFPRPFIKGKGKGRGFLNLKESDGIAAYWPSQVL